MPLGLTHIKVPKFSPQTMALAEVCALELWNGIDYKTGKNLDASDEDFLYMFARPTQAIYKNPNTTQSLKEVDIRELIRVANLKALFRSHQPTDFAGAISAYQSTAMTTYTGWRNKTLALPDPYSYATKATLDWSLQFVNNTSGISINGNHRVPLACRILFFSMPDMMVFNFSNALAKGMCLQSRPQAALPYFNKYLFEGLLLNSKLLSKLKMPQPKILNLEDWQMVKNGNWWERRVLDLALLLHFNLVRPTSTLQIAAKQLSANWSSSKKL